VAGVLAMLLFWRRCSSRADSKNCAARSVVRNREPLMVYNDLTTQFFTGK
jgi:hypothetical protein